MIDNKMKYPYYKFSDYLREKYGEKVYKLPVNITVSCPNRDGLKGSGGCIFCGEEGAGFECLPPDWKIEEQLSKNMEYIGKTYSASKFIAYFQNYSNTYLQPEKLEEYVSRACLPGVVAVYLSTRPDCVGMDTINVLARIRQEKQVDIVLEIGLQTININTLKILDRQHGIAEFTDAVLKARQGGIGTCAHYITDLPWDSLEDTREGARFLSALGVDQVKLHSLYILRGTRLGEMYEAGLVKPLAMDEYIERTIVFLENLSPNIAVQRLIGRAPAERSLFCNWQTGWRKIADMICEKMLQENRYQGKYFDYLDGAANRKKWPAKSGGSL